MKTTTQRMTIAIMAFVFAATTTSCKKENTITPGNTSVKPKSIITKENGTIVRTQTYEYNGSNKITQYVSAEGNRRDSMVLVGNEVQFISKINGVPGTAEILKFNADSTLNELSETKFSNGNTDRFSTDFSAISATAVALTGLISSAAEVVLSLQYTEENLSVISSDGGREKSTFTYLNNAAFQKGINEIPVASMAFKYHKIIEQEDIASYKFSNKLINTFTVAVDGVIKRIHTYSYIRDAQNRIVTINETISFPSTGAASKRLEHTITY
ncbi:MAG: hypothetical protein U0T77_05100 [Chitinophagales bacterium]